jgi:conjugal transfer mating pair stabilization protein TraG
MVWDIYSIGDGAFLTAVLNAVAMLSGSGDLRQLAGIGFAVGVILTVVQSAIQARPPQFQQMLIAWVVYSAMFGPTVKVSVEDLYSGAVRVVDQVPIGPAAIGSLLSNVGYGVTRLFEQAFSTPAMTTYGFASPLHLLQGVRKGTLSLTALGAANSPTPGADMHLSFVNFLNECILYDVDTRNRTLADVVHSASWQQVIATSSKMWTTQLWLGGDPVTKPCNEAAADLSAYTIAHFEPALRQSLATKLEITNPDAVPGAIRSALDAVAGEGVDAQNYMVMAVLAATLPQADAQSWREIQHFNDAIMIEQAETQRNTQWAAEETLFAKIVRPMMTFFEAFLFAVSPLLVFAIGLGPVGLRMIGKYLLFGLWIQLWQPILAIINLYILMSIQGKMDAIQAVGLGNLPLPSIAALWKLDFLLSDYLGIGGMLAASTPAISLMLIYGSAITATHLAGRLQGGDHINEKIAAPDVVNPAAALSMQPLQDHGPIRGTAAPGAEQVTWTAHVGQDTQRELRSSQQQAQRASVGFASALGSAASATASRSGQSFDAHAETWMKDATTSQTDQVLRQQAEGLTQQYSASGLSTNQMAAVIAGGLTGSGGAGAKANIETKLRTQYGVQSDLSDRMATDIAQQVTSNEGFEARVAEGLKVDSSSGDRNVFTSGLSTDESSRLTRSADDVVSASRSLDRAESLTDRFGMLGSYGAVSTGAALALPTNHALAERMDQKIARYGLEGDVQRETNLLMAGGVTADRAQARAMAGMGLLLGYTDGERPRTMAADEQLAAKEDGMAILGNLFRFQAPAGINAQANADLQSAAPAFGNTRTEVGGARLRDVRQDTPTLQDQLDAHGRGVADAWDPGAVDQFGAGAQRALSGFRSDGQTALRAGKQAQLGAIIDQHAMLPRPAAQLAHHTAGGLLVQLAESGALVEAGVAGVAHEVTAAAKAFGQTLLDGGGFQEAVAAGRTAAGSEQGWTGARKAMIEARMQQVAGFGLTDTQQQLFREATDSMFTELPSQAQQAARQAVIDEAGPQHGAQLAELIERSAGSKDDTELRLIGSYNTQTTEKKSPEHGVDGASRGGTGRALTAPPSLGDHFGAVERDYGLPTGLLTAIASVESDFNPKAVSPVGAQGMFQLMPKTAKALGISNPFDPVEAAEGAAQHLARDYRTFGNWNHAVMAYNAGPHRIATYLAGRGKPLKQETLDYLPKVSAAFRRVGRAT